MLMLMLMFFAKKLLFGEIWLRKCNSDRAITTTQKMKFSIKDKKSLMENFIFCAVYFFWDKSSLKQMIKNPLCHFKNKGCVVVMILHGYPPLSKWRFVENGTFL